jgi:ribonuclease HI
MVIDQHRAYAAFAYLEDRCPRDNNLNIDVSHLTGVEKKDRPKMYRDFATHAYWMKREAPGLKTSLYSKAKQWTDNPLIAEEAVQILKTHRKSISKLFTSYNWNLQFKLFMNCWATDCTRDHRGMTVNKRTNTYSDYPCYICGKGDDSTKHLLFECEVIQKAAKSYFETLKVTKIYNATNIMLLFKSNQPIEAISIITFNCAIWTQRTYHMTRANIMNQEDAHRRLVEHALDSLPMMGMSAPKTDNDPQNREINSLARNPPHNALTVFTDGSAQGDPRHAGAGIWIRGPSLGDLPPFEINISIPLGEGDNNSGEMWGLFIAGEAICALTTTQGIETGEISIVLSDSMGCIAYLTSTWPSPTQRKVSRATRKTYNNHFKTQKGRIYWIRGHTDIDGNDRADVLAKKGAKNAIKGHTPSTGITVSYTNCNSLIKSVINVKWATDAAKAHYAK